jgi:hypothetical protein
VLSAACGTRPAEFFNGWARKLKRHGYSSGYSNEDSLEDSLEDSRGYNHGIAYVSSREKIPPGSGSPRRPTRSDLRSFIASAVGRLRNSPERTFQRLDTQTDVRQI